MDIDAIFRLPLSEFTAARNELVSRLKAAGKTDVASRVKAIPKPPLSAWVVNQLYWRHRKPFDELLAAGERLRRAQATTLRAAGTKGADMQEPTDARRAALSDLTRRAAAILEGSGHTASPDITRRITTTLDALATWGHASGGPQPGRLTNDVEAPGFEALASLVGRPPGRRAGPTRVIPFAKGRQPKRETKPTDPKGARRRADEEKAQRAALAEAVRDAERALAEARRTAARAEAALKQAAARAKAAEQKKDALNARLEKLAADADRARQEARRVAAQAEEAAQAVADAERALEDARRAQQEARA